MAEKLTDDSVFVRRRRAPMYPWHRWLDGSIWRLTRGEDFHNRTPESFRQAVRDQAKKRGLVVRTAMDDFERVIIQVIDKGEAHGF